MKIFCTGAAGYIGGSVAANLIAAGHQVTGLVGSPKKPTRFARGASSRYWARWMMAKFSPAPRRPPTSSSTPQAPTIRAPSSRCWTRSPERQAVHPHVGFEHRRHARPRRTLRRDFDEDTPITPSPARAARVALNELILSYRDKACRPVIVCPSLIYCLGHGANPDSVQVPLLIKLARKRGNAAHAGPGENVWSNVHIDDLVPLYAMAIEKAPAGAFYFAENGEHSMREACEAINRMLGFAGPPSAMSMQEAAAEWGEGTAQDTMASNSRVRAKRARQDSAGSRMREA